MFLEILQSYASVHEKQQCLEVSQISTAARNNRGVVSAIEAATEEEELVQEEQETEEEAGEAEAVLFRLDEGEVADPKVFPVLNKFKIPQDNIQTLTQLHKEVVRAMQTTSTIF